MIATQIVADAYQHRCDVAIIVSADSDMIPAIELAIEAKVTVFVYFPPNHYSNALASIGTTRPVMLQKYETRFASCRLPDIVHLTNANYDIHIPEKWKEFLNKDKQV